MTPELQQFVDTIQQQWQAAQEPLQQLWSGSQYIAIAGLAVLAGTFFLLLLGLLVGRISRGRLSRRITSLDESLRETKQEGANERKRALDDRSKLLRGFEEQLAELKGSAEQEIQAARNDAAAAEASAKESISQAEARHKQELDRQKAATEEALIKERDYHRIEINRVKDEASATSEALRVLKSQGQGSERLRSQIDDLTRQVRELESNLDTERQRSARLEGEKRRAEENARALSGSTNSDLQRECERLQQQLESVLAAPLTSSITPQLDVVETFLNAAIEAYATRDVDGAVTSISNAAQLIGQLKRAEAGVL